MNESCPKEVIDNTEPKKIKFKGFFTFASKD